MFRVASLPLAIGLVVLGSTTVRANEKSLLQSCIDCPPVVAQQPSAPVKTVVKTATASPAFSITSPKVVGPPVYRRERIVGLVQQANGATLIMKLDNGQQRIVRIPDASGADFRGLVGKRIVLTDVDCTPPVPATPLAIRTPPVPQRW